MRAPILQLTNVTKRFRGLVATDRVSLTVAAGSITSLIGPNGAGKSTIFNLVTGYLPLSEGEIRFHDERIDGKSTVALARRGIARAFQIAKPFPDISVHDNVRIGALFGRDGRRDVDQVTERALALTGLEDFADRPAGDLTVGFLRRLEIARAIAARPILLLADEPCAGLNPAETEEICDILRRIRARGTTVFLVEHDMEAVMRISDNIIVLDAGAKIAEGTPGEISANPAVIAAYLGTPDAA
ncbi:MAG: ABC transporter ATP-binding protein [Acetobacteraceae bacterium]|nr:ABC transporter ATP-binding protein [Acetobacteraceae bacterium]